MPQIDSVDPQAQRILELAEKVRTTIADSYRALSLSNLAQVDDTLATTTHRRYRFETY